MAQKIGESEELSKEEGPQFGKLVAPSADSHQFELLNPGLITFFLTYVSLGFYGAFVFATAAKLPTAIFALSLAFLSMLGVTAGVHRLWSHRSYRAKPPLEILLVTFFLLANQRSIVEWSRRHRLHHKCSDTDADPHNATRGFFFSHFGWMLVKPHPEVLKREKYIDVSDLMSNPIIRFQEKHLDKLLLVVTYIIPTLIPMLWGESLYVSFFCNIFRQNVVLHMVNSINSVAHLVGYKPIDKTAPGTQYRFMGLMIFGEGFHNFHHAFPYDYNTSELGDLWLNTGTLFIRLMAKIGWAYDLKTTSEESVRNRVLRKGDGTDQHYNPNNERKQEFFCIKLYKSA